MTKNEICEVIFDAIRKSNAKFDPKFKKLYVCPVGLQQLSSMEPPYFMQHDVKITVYLQADNGCNFERADISRSRLKEIVEKITLPKTTVDAQVLMFKHPVLCDEQYSMQLN